MPLYIKKSFGFVRSRDLLPFKKNRKQLIQGIIAKPDNFSRIALILLNHCCADH